MKQGQFSQAQIITILHEAEAGQTSITEICRQHGITQTTFYRWRRQFANMTVSEAQHLKELERENARLKRLLAERDLEIDALKAFLSKK
jgi:putative transposase